MSKVSYDMFTSDENDLLTVVILVNNIIATFSWFPLYFFHHYLVLTFFHWTDSKNLVICLRQSSFSRYTFLTDLEMDFYSLLLFMLIIWQCSHNLASTGNIK